MDKYAFLMIKYKTPQLFKDIQDELSEDDVYYNEEENSHTEFGIEKDTHVTIAACLDNDTDVDELKKYLKPLEEYKAFITNISTFNCHNYDVLKSDVASIPLFNTNEKIKEKHELHTEHKEYHPHATIAYLKHGIAEKYTKEILDKLVVLEPEYFWYTYYDKDGNSQKITWK